MSRTPADAPRVLSEPDAAGLLAAAGIPYVDHGVAATADAAVAVAARLHYPVVLKLVSPDVVHKTDVGGVLVGLADERAVRGGFEEIVRRVRERSPDARIDGMIVARHLASRRELIVGAVRDATFGPTVMVGLGGVFAELIGDVAFRLAPLRRREALDMLRELRAAHLLAEVRGEGAIDLEQVAALIVRVGDLFLSRPEITEIDLNPVAASSEACVALDVRIVVKV